MNSSPAFQSKLPIAVQVFWWLVFGLRRTQTPATTAKRRSAESESTTGDDTFLKSLHPLSQTEIGLSNQLERSEFSLRVMQLSLTNAFINARSAHLQHDNGRAGVRI